MSAENYVEVRKFDDGWRYAMGLVNDGQFKVLPDSKFEGQPAFQEADDAYDAAYNDLGVIEYGCFRTDQLAQLDHDVRAERLLCAMYIAHHAAQINLGPFYDEVRFLLQEMGCPVFKEAD